MISQFKDTYRWLSNFSPCTIGLDGEKYPSIEHAYMSAKSNDRAWKMFCANTLNPAEVKRESRTIQLIDNWDTIKLNVMQKCLEQKYNQEPYKTYLINTGDRYIQEGNYWGDKFWGVCLKTGKGENHLGKMIMKIREKLYEGE